MKARITALVIVLPLFLAACAATPSQYDIRTDAAWASVQVGTATRDSILARFGKPDEVTYLSLRDLTVWSYRYRQSDIWYSMMHVHFDRNGVVREMLSGPDPEREERRFWR